MKTRFLLSVVIAAGLAGGLHAQKPAATAQQPKAPAQQQKAPAQQAQQAQQQTVQLTTVRQLCQIREREIVGLSSQIFNRNRAAQGQKDAVARAQILAPVAELRNQLGQAEGSWQRLNCARLIYDIR